jgi:hypothetical protein
MTTVVPMSDLKARKKKKEGRKKRKEVRKEGGRENIVPNR